MKEIIQQDNEYNPVPMLFPYEPNQFWQQVRLIIREEISQLEKNLPAAVPATLYQTTGMQYKPLYKMTEICSMFQISRPTIYEWIKYGRLKPYKIRSRVYFLWNDIQQLLNPSQPDQK